VLFALGAVLLAALMISFSSVLLALPIGITALVLAGLGLLAGYRTPVGLAVGILFFGLMLTGTFLDASVEVLLTGTVACALIWDFGENAISIGQQLSRDSSTVQIEGIHAMTSTMIGVVGAGLVYGIYTASTGGKPLPALVLMLVGVVVLGWLIRR
jgi:hypothetical protein